MTDAVELWVSRQNFSWSLVEVIFCDFKILRAAADEKIEKNETVK
jgi:hypothetical protein